MKNLENGWKIDDSVFHYKHTLGAPKWLLGHSVLIIDNSKEVVICSLCQVSNGKCIHFHKWPFHDLILVVYWRTVKAVDKGVCLPYDTINNKMSVSIVHGQIKRDMRGGLWWGKHDTTKRCSLLTECFTDLFYQSTTCDIISMNTAVEEKHSSKPASHGPFALTSSSIMPNVKHWADILQSPIFFWKWEFFLRGGYFQKNSQ